MFLEIKDLRKSYNKVQALKGISFQVPENSIFGLLGPNGAGKTTFIRILNRIIAYDSGQILFNGEPLNDKHVERIGYLPEERGLYKKMAVGEQIIYFAQLKGLSKQQAYKKARKLLQHFEMLGWWNKKIEELSKGMQQKVQFVITIIHDPDLLIFDEPFSGFDPINQKLLKQEILKLQQQGKTILFSTHNMASVEELCDSIVLINKGEIILQGKINDIKQQFKQNIYIIKFQNPETQLPETQNFQILEHKNQVYTVKIHNASANDLLNYAMQFGTIALFEEKLPDLDEIFISAVKNHKTSQQ